MASVGQAELLWCLAWHRAAQGLGHRRGEAGLWPWDSGGEVEAIRSQLIVEGSCGLEAQQWLERRGLGSWHCGQRGVSARDS